MILKVKDTEGNISIVEVRAIDVSIDDNGYNIGVMSDNEGTLVKILEYSVYDNGHMIEHKVFEDEYAWLDSSKLDDILEELKITRFNVESTETKKAVEKICPGLKKVEYDDGTREKLDTFTIKHDGKILIGWES